MGVQELGKIYGPNNRGRVILARAVRAEIPGSSQLFDLVSGLYRARQKNPELEPLYRLADEALQEMKTAIAKKYQLKTWDEDHGTRK